jgi:hypothetical protein
LAGVNCQATGKDYKSSAKLAKQKDCKMQGLAVESNFLTPDETTKIRLLGALVGLAIGLALPAFAQ